MRKHALVRWRPSQMHTDAIRNEAPHLPQRHDEGVPQAALVLYLPLHVHQIVADLRAAISAQILLPLYARTRMTRQGAAQAQSRPGECETLWEQRRGEARQHGQAAHKFAARQQLDRDLHRRVAPQVERLDHNAESALPERASLRGETPGSAPRAAWPHALVPRLRDGDAWRGTRACT